MFRIRPIISKDMNKNVSQAFSQGVLFRYEISMAAIGVETDLISDYHAPHYDFVFSFLLRSLSYHILNHCQINVSNIGENNLAPI